jgi:hypothetical protein
LNADSLTDIGVAAAREYWEAIKHRTSTLLSINHEANEFTVAELIREDDCHQFGNWLQGMAVMP